MWLRWTYTAWLALLILLVAGGLPLWWSSLSQPVVTPPPAGLIVGAPYFLPGALCFPLSVLLSGAALVLMFREEPERAPATEPRTGWQRVSALALTAGVLVWLAGFYLMPEATTAACPPIIFSVTQFAHGACAGLDSDQALAAAQDASLNPVALAFSALGWHFELLVAVGLITALGAWTRQLAARTLAWLAVWPLLALGVALVALQGAQVIAREGFQLTVATGGGWHVGPGMIGAFAGIGLVALGQAGLWREALRRNRAVSEPVNQVSAEAVSSHQRHVRPALREGEAIRAAGVALVALSR